MRILVLVLSARTRPYPTLIRAIKRTWASERMPGVETLFYYGGESLYLDGEDIVLPVRDGPHQIGRKTIACFEYILANREFDLAFRTNASSYVDLSNLKRYAEEKATPRRFYSGIVGTRPLPFASGSGYFLSRDLVELVVAQKERWNHSLVDDAAVADLLAEHGVLPEPAPRRDYRHADEVSSADTHHFHFRCRTESWGRLEDIRIMTELHRLFRRQRGLPVESGGWVRIAVGTVLADLRRLAAPLR